jgi:cell division protein FtsQ
MRSSAAALRRPVDVGARLRAALAPGPRLQLRLALIVATALLLVGGYMLWLRDSSLVAVEEVTVTGLTIRDADRVRTALTSTAQTMTTLHLDEARLRDAVAGFPAVADIEVTPDFPHGLTIQVIEHRPVAMLDSGSRRVPVAGDGTVLTGVTVEGELPTIELSGALPLRAIPPGGALEAAKVAGGAPAVISRRLESIARDGERGIVVEVANGPELVFGSAEQVAAKWAAALRVLVDGDADGAAYIDVRIPERPVAGGLAVETVTPVAPMDATVTDPSLAAPVDPASVAPIEPPADGTAVAPEPSPEAVAPAPVTPAPQTPAETGGGAAPYPQP